VINIAVNSEKVTRRRVHDDEVNSEEESEKKMRKKPDSSAKKPDSNDKKVLSNPTGDAKSNVMTQNRYDALSDHEDTDLAENEDPHMEEDILSSEEVEVNDEKPPPIVLHGKYEYKKLLAFCKEGTTQDVCLKFTKNNTIIITQSVQDFNILKEGLKTSKKTQWHTYATKGERTHGFVIYGLDNSPAEADVKQDLEEKGINCKYVYKMKNTNSPLYVVITDNKTTLRDLESKAKTVEFVIVKWKKLINSRKIIQCHKCQVWGHAASNCHANPKCLKCAKDHLTSDCTLKKEVPEDQKLLKCANCGQGHLANSTSCDVYLARKSHVEKIRASAAAKRPKQNANFVPAPIPVTNPWTAHRNNTDQNRNPAAAHMSALRSKLSEEVATQSTSPGPATTNSFVDQETIDDMHIFLQIRDEIKKLKQKIDFKKLLESLKSLNDKITLVSSQTEIVSALLNIEDSPSII
jgi:hypothetical protein